MVCFGFLSIGIYWYVVNKLIIKNISEFYIYDFFFLGKLFKCAELPWVIQFFLMFHNDKPVDWLLDHLVSTKVCSLDKDSVSYYI